MSEERRKVLKMLAEGKVTAEEAERLLERLGQSEQRGETAVMTMDPPRSKGPKAPLKFLRVLVDSSDGDQVNIRIPLALVRTGIKLTTLMPSNASKQLAEKGVDLSELGDLEGEALIEALRELNVDVDSHDGDKVRIFCE